MPLDLPAPLRRAVRSGDLIASEHGLKAARVSHETRAVLDADIKRQAGALDEALAILRGLHVGTLTPAVAVFAARVEGEVLSASGRTSQALEVLNRALVEGEAAQEHQQVALASLSRFTLLTNHRGLAESQQALQNAKAAVLRSGDAQLLAALHARVGQAHAQRNLASLAVGELESALALLRPEPNAAIQAFAELALSGAEHLLARSQEAVRWARASRKTAETNGLRALSASAQANLAFLEFRRGSFTRAREEAISALKEVPPLSLARGALLDTLANIAVERGDLAHADALVHQIEELIAVLNRATLLLVDSAPVRARVAQLHGDWEGACRHLSEAAVVADSRGDLLGWAKLVLLRAEAAYRWRGNSSSGDDLVSVLSRVQYPSAETLGLLARVRGVRAAVRGDLPAAKAEFARADRVFGVSGERFLRRQTSRVASEVQPSPDQGFPAPKRRPILRLAQDLAFVCGLLPHAHLASIELRRLLCRLNIKSTVHASTDQLEKVEAHALYMGTVGRTRVHIVADDPEAAESREVLFHIFSVVRRACDGVRAQSEQRRKFLSWDLDIAPEGKAGLYISSDMKRLLKTITRVAVSDIPVLITGDTGTGKEIVATEVHECSPRSSKPFIALNVAAVPRDMLEGHLFGYRRGAFTGAVNDAKGMIREAEGGTLFIDEIGELSLDLQPKLLRFLESGEIQPLGERPQRVDVRIVAATNARLETLVREGRFREDLFYRLNVVTLTVPPLRDRREEIPTLINHFLTVHAKAAGKLIPQLTPRALERLSAYDWPGNVRQLTNELKRIVALSDEDELVDLEHLAPRIRDLVEPTAQKPSDGSTVTLDLDRDLQGLYDDLERAAIARAMDVSRQNQSECARRLGITRKGLYLKRKRLGLADDTVADQEDDVTAPAPSAR